MWFIRFKQTLTFFLLPWLMALLIQSLGRIYLFFSYVDLHQILDYRRDIFSLFVIGLRFDIRVSCLLFGILLILLFPCFFSAKLYAVSQKYILLLSSSLVMLCLLFTVINIFYFMTYYRHIDVFLFGLIDDDTTAIIKTIWLDYPVVWVAVGLMLGSLLVARIEAIWHAFVFRKIRNVSPAWIKTPTLFITLIFIFVGARGGWGVFPLRQSDAQISHYSILNQFVPNGLIAFDWAYKGYKMNNQFVPVSLEDRDKALNSFFGQSQPDSLAMFIRQTAMNPVAEKKPPHVIFSVMESMGSHFFEFDEPERDLLGSLRAHWKNDWVFLKFISEGDGTIDSLSRFFVRSPMDKISQSSAQTAQFVSNMFKPFKEKGYKVVYITAGNGAWRNLNRFLPHLGVDEFIEQNTLLQKFPEAKAGTWGVDDEYMFRYAKQRLAQAEKDGQPVFMMLMSVSNHPPYIIPKNHHYQNYSFRPDELKRLKNLGSETEIRNIFNTFRYSNQQLGDFIDWVKKNNLGRYTIIGVTGDHNLRGIGYPDPKEMALSHAVPFYLYVPTRYRYQTRYDQHRIGSHKDIIPTLYSLSLSATEYYQTGCNLLAEELDQTWCHVGYNPYVIIDKLGAYSLVDNTFMPWGVGLRLKAGMKTISETENTTLARWKSWTTLLQWQINKQIEGSQK